MHKPNLFIVGAPKCGTSALAEYLGEHPAIFMSEPKEPHFFATDMPGHRVVTSMDAYLEIFSNAAARHRVLFEASVFYLYSRTAIANIHAFNPDAKLIAMLRNPVDMVYSMHSQALHSTDEDEPDFMRAWQLQDERLTGRRLPRNCHTPAILQYRALGRYSEQMERMFSIFPKEQVKIVLFDDFKRDTKAVYEDVLAFLGVPSDGHEHFEVINANKQRRFWRLSAFFRSPPPALRDAWRFAKRLPGLDERVAQGFHDWLERANTRIAPRTDLPPDTRRILCDVFQDDVARLSELLGRDLSKWVTV
jgi:hypothetical protein